MYVIMHSNNCYVHNKGRIITFESQEEIQYFLELFSQYSTQRLMHEGDPINAMQASMTIQSRCQVIPDFNREVACGTITMRELFERARWYYLNYIMRYKGSYRLKVELDKNTNDFVRRADGSLEDIDVYIDCRNGGRIYSFGHINNTRPVWLIAYTSSKKRGRNIIKALEEKGVELVDIIENDEEVEFKFKAADIEIVAELMKARTAGANISPFSSKNLPRSNVEIPTEEIARYKEITSVIPKTDLLLISRLTNEFLENVLQKDIRRITRNKKYEYKSEMKKLKLARQVKEYIWTKNYWDKYLDYLKKEIEKNYNK